MADANVRYGTVAVIFHWLIAGLILYMFWLGYSMVHLMDPFDEAQFTRFQLHKSIGLTILVLSVLRLAWRLLHKAPPLPAKMKAWERWTAHVTHALLYVVMIGVPLAGWLAVSSSPLGLPTRIFGLFEWPHFAPFADLRRAEKAEIYEPIRAIHMYMAYGGGGLIVLHVAAALKHHFWDRDTVLTRMVPFARPLGAGKNGSPPASMLPEEGH